MKPESETTQSEPQLIARENGLWVVNKPAGWLVHPVGVETGDSPGGSHRTPDVLNWVRSTQANVGSSLAALHRLDKGTSGVLLLSDDERQKGELGRAFGDREVKKRYLAVVYGRTRRKGVIRRPMFDNRRRRRVDATTRYRLKSWLGPLSLLIVRPEQGRKHQIRRHLSNIGHCVVGDMRYRPVKRNASAPVPEPRRLWLHAYNLELPNGRAYEAELPSELAEHLALLLQLEAELRETADRSDND